MAATARTVLAPSRRIPLAWIAAAIAVDLALAVALLDRPLVVAGAVIAVAAFALALTRPVLVFGAAVLTLGFVPVYASPKLGPVPLEPTAMGLWLVGGALALRTVLVGRGTRITIVDWAAAAFFGLMLVPVVLGVQAPSDFVHLAALWLGPYLGARLFVEADPRPGRTAELLGALALAIVPLIALEVATGENPFFGLARDGASAELWGTGQERLGAARAEGAFGHSIALSMFLAAACLCCVGLALHARSRTARWWWLASAAVVVGALAATLSRTGWLVVAVGIVLIGVAAPASAAARRKFVAAVVAVGALAYGVAAVMPGQTASPLQLVRGDAELQRSSDYRRELLRLAVESDALTLFGNRERRLSEALGQTGSIDNAYLAIGQDWGVAALVGLALVGLSLLVALFRLRRAGVATVVPAVGVAMFVGLLVVSLITQQQILIWALVGASAGLLARQRRAEGARSGGGIVPWRRTGRPSRRAARRRA